MKKFDKILLLFLWCGFSTVGIIAVDEDLDSQFLSENNSSSSEMKEEKTDQWQINGFAQNENHFGATGINSARKSDIIKLESRVNLKFKYTASSFYIKGNFDAFYYPEVEAGTKVNPHSKVLETQELYIGGGENFQFKIGKMLLDYSTADAFSVVNYMIQADMRELFVKDSADVNRGIFAVELKYILGDFSFEFALTPVHNRPLFASQGSFWQISVPSVSSLALPTPFYGTGGVYTNGVTPAITVGDPLESSFKNISGTLRAGGSIGSLDFHLLYFNGIDQSIIFVPTTTMTNFSSPSVSIDVAPAYNKVDSFGFDLAYDYKQFTLRAETSYTPRKWLMLKEDPTQIVDVANQKVTVTNQLTTEQYLAYTIGFDVKIFSDDRIFLVEWMQAQPLKNQSKYNKEFFTDILLLRLEDKFLQQRLKVSLTGVIRPRPHAHTHDPSDTTHKDQMGYIISPELSWDFENGLTLIWGGSFFVGNGDDLIQPFENNDLVYTRARFTF